MEYHTDIMKPEDWDQVRSIYLEGIVTANSTFEADAPDWDKWDFAHLLEHRLVVRDGDSIIAWAALSPVSIILPEPGETLSWWNDEAPWQVLSDRIL